MTIENNKTQAYWTTRYLEERTGWDIGYPSTPIKEYIDQLTNTNAKILIPGAGNAYEAAYLHQQGFKNVFILDISPIPLENFRLNNPDFPKENLLHQDFFTHKGQYDLILEQAFFCSFPPTEKNRVGYAKKIEELLKPKGKLVGVWFNKPLSGDMEKRPFGGSKSIYTELLRPYFNSIQFKEAYNSIPARVGEELFGIVCNV